MTKAEIEAILEAAFKQCQAGGFPLKEMQKQILLQVAQELMQLHLNSLNGKTQNVGSTNPLDELTGEQRQALLKFIKEQEGQNRAWKIAILNDWLNNRDSGKVQFIRDRFGFQWLNRVQPIHLAEYYDQADNETLKLKVGDRIEVSNGLWEWVQADGPCDRIWVPCTVIYVDDGEESESNAATCIIRFDNGNEYEIQGVYDWNRYNWRWPSV